MPSLLRLGGGIVVPEPDLLVYRADADTGPGRTWYAPEDVVLAVEVVSPDSPERDGGVEPRTYAEAGVKHFWRVEQGDDLPVSTSTSSTRPRAPARPPEATTRR
ncbi:Uma2 family endonuclease [Streptomyces globisporus]